MPGVAARVQRADGTYTGLNGPGDLIIKTHPTVSCYSNDEGGTKKTFVDGWLRTGDGATINENMEILVVDHLREMLKACGSEVASAQIETHLAEHPFVSDAHVVGIPREFHGVTSRLRCRREKDRRFYREAP